MNFLKNTIYIFKTDWIRIVKNPLTLIVISGLMIIPSLYAWFNIEALWDPYGNASNLPIGVYSADKGYEVQGQNINIGTGVVDALKEDNQLSWQIVSSKEELTKSVQNGTFYGSIYMPKDFTENLLSVLNGNYEKPVLEYTVNEKINAIAPKMTEAGAEGISQEIKEGFNGVLSGVVLETANELGIELDEKLPLFSTLFNKIHLLNNKAQEFDEFLNSLNTINSNLPEYEENLNELDIDKIIDNLNTIALYIHKLNEQMPEIIKIKDRVNEIDQNIVKLEDISNVINDINDTLNKMNNELKSLNVNVDNINNNFSKYKNIINEAKNYQGSISEILIDLGLTIEDVDQFVNDVYNILDKAFDLLKMLVLDLGTISNNLSNFLSNTTLSPTDITNIINTLTSLNSILTNVENLISNLLNILNPINIISGGSLTNLISSLNNVNSNINNLQTSINYVINNINNLDTTTIINYLNDIVISSNQIVLLINRLDLEKIRNEIHEVLNNTQSMISSGEVKLNNLNFNDMNNMIISAQNILKIIKTYTNNLNFNYEDLNKFINKLDVFLQDNSQQIINIMNRINSFFQNDIDNFAIVINNIDSFMQSNLKQVENNLRGNVDLLKAEIPKLEKVLSQTDEFTNNTWPKLRDFLEQIDNQVTKISENQELEKMVNYLINDVKKGSDFIANPVELKTIRMYPVENYGSASAPFYTTLCLWVGAVLLTSVLSTHFHKENTKRKLTDKEVFLGRFFTFLSIAIIQALIVSIGDIYLLKVVAVSPYLFILFTVIISVCFTAIVYTLANLFGNVGKALAVIGLVLSISGGGGNFPIEVSGPFFQAINPLLPFTHGVNLLREPIGGIYLPTVYTALIVLILYTIIFLIIGLFAANFINPIMNKLEKISHESHIFH